MHINLIYNETAGDGSQSIASIVKRLKDHGANVLAFNKKSVDLSNFLMIKCDFLLIAGGDGTVQEVLKKIIQNPVPFAILPLGNANNMAESLNLDDYLGKIVRNWKNKKTTPLSIGYLEQEGKTHYFFESVGWGLFADTLARIKKEKKRWNESPDDKVAFGLKKLKDSINDLKSSHYQIEVDGMDYSGEYVWIEVMNTPFMGPNLHLAPNADPEDQYLDVILIKKAEKEKIERFIEHQKQTDHYRFDLALKAREVLINFDGSMHVDDELLERESKNRSRQNWLKLCLYPKKLSLVPSY
ncbi:diacylglycerol/lipid kinase family protein [Cyclobacterium salsum]|uniref:diacylglycerol/lipid kinase family protein n=1 Tax=Cyclobacterium salsum TaxID=2666329 RepID=UPI00139120B5|nr:diacylglycerol kinase family protein [Cyclobacterium salsum]